MNYIICSLCVMCIAYMLYPAQSNIHILFIYNVNFIAYMLYPAQSNIHILFIYNMNFSNIFRVGEVGGRDQPLGQKSTGRGLQTTSHTRQEHYKIAIIPFCSDWKTVQLKFINLFLSKKFPRLESIREKFSILCLSLIRRQVKQEIIMSVKQEFK